MAIGDAMVAPQGISRPDLESERMGYTPARGVPGYAQGLGQAPGQMAMPPEPMPIGRPTAVVGGPAYFTPQGYNAPPQPTQAFMPTDVRPDPIGQQFMRQYESPMGQQFIDQYEATQAPMREAEAVARAEAQAAQDARFQEMMDRIAELEGQLATPEPASISDPNTPLPVDPYVPSGPFPEISDFIRNIDFSNLPGLSNFDYDEIMNQFKEKKDLGDRIPKTMKENDLLGGLFRSKPVDMPTFTPPVEMPRSTPFIGFNDAIALDKDGNPTRRYPDSFYDRPMGPGNPLYNAPPDMVAPTFTFGNRDVDPVLTKPIFNRPTSPIGIDPFEGITTPINPNVSNTPKFDLPSTGRRPMIPSFGNFNLR